MTKLIFIGASGMLGKPVAKELIKTGFEVTLLARDEMKQRFPTAKIILEDKIDKPIPTRNMLYTEPNPILLGRQQKFLKTIIPHH